MPRRLSRIARVAFGLEIQVTSCPQASTELPEQREIFPRMVTNHGTEKADTFVVSLF